VRSFAPPAVAALSLLLLAPGIARADDDDDARLRDGVHTYANSRLREATGLLVAGAGSATGGGLSLAQGGRFEQALGVPLIAGGAFEIGLGSSLLASAIGWESGAASTVGDASYRQSELARLDAMRARARVTEAIEATVVGAGVLTAYFGGGNDIVRGAGVGVAIDAVVLLAADVLGTYRADGYAAALRGTTLSASPDRRGGFVSFSHTF
jgi:hypothetical protein